MLNNYTRGKTKFYSLYKLNYRIIAYETRAVETGNVDK